MLRLAVQQVNAATGSALQRCIHESRRPEATQHLAEIVATLEASGYDCSEVNLLGEGSESSAYRLLAADGSFRVLKITSPLSLGWEPDWGFRSIDALTFAVNGEHINELGNQTYWYVQEFAETFSRAEDIDDDLLNSFILEMCRIGENLFLDDTGLGACPKTIKLLKRVAVWAFSLAAKC